MHISCRLHIAENVFLEFGDRLERIGNVLILPNVTDDFCSFGTFGEVYQICAFDDRRNTVLDKCKVRQVDT